VAEGVCYSFTHADPVAGDVSLRPMLPLVLQANGLTIQATGLVDTGAAVNVLPFRLGEDLGFEWESQKVKLRLTGNLAGFEARAVLVDGQVDEFAVVRLAFAWTTSDEVPLLLGQTNFLERFDVLFSRSRRFFEVFPAGLAPSSHP
jgi:hypothetical protein